MARIVLNTAMIQDMSGKMGPGAVIAKWKGIHYVRMAAVTITNPRTLAQAKMREGLVAALVSWRTLTKDQRALWEEYAQGLGTAATDAAQTGSRGIIPLRSRRQSGPNAYTGVTQRLRSVGYAPVTEPPVGAIVGPISLVAEFIPATLTEPPRDAHIRVTVGYTDPIPVTVTSRLWLKGLWAGSHAYIEATPVGDGVSKEIEINIFQIRVGSQPMGYHRVDCLSGREVAFQADAVDTKGRVSPASGVVSVRVA